MMNNNTMWDLWFERHGSVTTIHGVSETGEQWIEDNVQAEEWQKMGGAIVGDTRMCAVVADGAQRDGMRVLVK